MYFDLKEQVARLGIEWRYLIDNYRYHNKVFNSRSSARRELTEDLSLLITGAVGVLICGVTRRHKIREKMYFRYCTRCFTGEDK